MTNPTNLITLTASDLDGCRGGMRLVDKSHPQCDITFVGVIGDVICTQVYDSRTQMCVSIFTRDSIQCHPSDYIRAWLGPVGELHKHCRFAFAIGESVLCMQEDRHMRDIMDCELHDCPAALASAMGSSVWRRTETGWEVVE